MPPTVAVVIPAYNEEARLAATLGAVEAYRDSHGQVTGVIVADDGSTDRTVEVAGKIDRALGLEVSVLRLPHAGKAWAVRTAMLHAAESAAADYLLMLDADNEIAIDHLAEVPWTGNPSTVYIGRRVGAVGERMGTRPSLLRRLMSTGMRTMSRLLLRLPYPDTQCGFKLFPRHLIDGLFRQQRSRGWVFDAEVLAIARRSGIPIVEVPVVWNPRGASRVRPSAAVSSSLALLAIAARLAAGRYRRVSAATP